MPSGNERYMMMMKASLPYLSADARKMFQSYLKLNQIMQTLQEFDREQEELLMSCSVQEEDREAGLFQVIREYCTPKEQEMADMIINIMQISKLWKEMENLE